MNTGFDDSREIGGRDPLDARLTPPPSEPTPSDTWLRRVLRRLRMSAAFGLAPVLAPALVFVPLGALFGPQGLNLLSTRVLQHLDPVISLSLATLGVFVGLALGRRPSWNPRLFVAASIESGVTILVVSSALVFLVRAWDMPLAMPLAALALILGVSASASSATHDATPGSPDALAARIADLDDVLPIVVGALAIAAVGRPGLTSILWPAIATLGVGLAAGVIGWLLIERAHSDAERGIFVVGALALVAGGSAYLSLSPLLAGLAAGMFWNWSPGRCDTIVREDLGKFQHPVVVLMLLSAGALLEYSVMALWLFAPFVVFRLAGKLTGGWLASKLTPTLASADLSSHLLAPGLLGIAFALNAYQYLHSAEGIAALTAVVVGTLASEGVAFAVAPGEADA